MRDDDDKRTREDSALSQWTPGRLREQFSAEILSQTAKIHYPAIVLAVNDCMRYSHFDTMLLKDVCPFL